MSSLGYYSKDLLEKKHDKVPDHIANIYLSFVDHLFPNHRVVYNRAASVHSPFLIYHNSVNLYRKKYEWYPESLPPNQLYFSEEERRMSFQKRNKTNELEPITDSQMLELFKSKKELYFKEGQWDFSKYFEKDLFPTSEDKKLQTMEEKIQVARKRRKAVYQLAKDLLGNIEGKSRMIDSVVQTIILKMDPDARLVRMNMAEEGREVSTLLREERHLYFWIVNKDSDIKEPPSPEELTHTFQEICKKSAADAIYSYLLSGSQKQRDIAGAEIFESHYLKPMGGELLNRVVEISGLSQKALSMLLTGVNMCCVSKKMMEWFQENKEFLSQNEEKIETFCQSLSTPLTNNKRLSAIKEANYPVSINNLEYNRNEQGLIKTMFLNMFMMRPQETMRLITEKSEFLKDTLINFAGQNILGSKLDKSGGFYPTAGGMKYYKESQYSNHPSHAVYYHRDVLPKEEKENFQQSLIWNYINYIENKEEARISFQAEQFALSILHPISAYGMTQKKSYWMTPQFQKDIIDLAYKIAHKFEANEEFINQATEQIGPMLLSEYLYSILIPQPGRKKSFSIAGWNGFCSQEKYQKYCQDKLSTFRIIGGVILSQMFQTMPRIETELKLPEINQKKKVLWDIPEYNQHVSGSRQKSQRALRVASSQSSDPFFIYKESIVNSMQAGSSEVRLSFYQTAQSKSKGARKQYMTVIDDKGEGVPSNSRYVFVLPSKSYGKNKIGEGMNKNFGQGMKAIWNQKGRFLNIWTHNQESQTQSTLLFFRPSEDDSFNVYEHQTKEEVPYENEVPFSYSQKESGTRIVLNEFGDYVDMQMNIYKLQEILSVYPFIDIYINGKRVSAPQVIVKTEDMAVVWMDRENKTIPHTELPLKSFIPINLQKEGYSSLRVMRKHEAQNSTRSGVYSIPFDSKQKKEVMKELIQIQLQSREGASFLSPLHYEAEQTGEEKFYSELFNFDDTESILRYSTEVLKRNFPKICKGIETIRQNIEATSIEIEKERDDLEEEIEEELNDLGSMIQSGKDEDITEGEAGLEALNNLWNELPTVSRLKYKLKVKSLISKKQKLDKKVHTQYLNLIQTHLGKEGVLLVHSIFQKNNQIIQEDALDRLAEYLVSVAENKKEASPLMTKLWKELPHLRSHEETKSYEFMLASNDEEGFVFSKKTNERLFESTSIEFPSFKQLLSSTSETVEFALKRSQQKRVPIQKSFLVESESDPFVELETQRGQEEGSLISTHKKNKRIISSPFIPFLQRKKDKSQYLYSV